MSAQIVTAIYKPKKGQDAALQALIAIHVPKLRELGLATDRPSIVMRSAQNGTYIEIFEWVSAEAPGQAHENPEVLAIWGPMMEIALLHTLAELQESTTPFPHFETVADLCC